VNIDLLLAAAELVDDIDGQRRREAEAVEHGIRLGFGHGYDVGFAHAAQQADREWADFGAAVQSMNRRSDPQRDERRVAEAVAATERLVRRMQWAHWDRFMARRRREAAA
jgi:hypothetical protein